MNAEDEIFSAIVSMCSDRILSRMRLAPHKRNKPRQTIIVLLQETIKLLGAKFPDYRRNAQTVVKLLNLWAKHQTEQRLRNVIDAVLQLSRTNDLSRLLGSIPNNCMGPSERTNLLKMIKRVGSHPRQLATTSISSAQIRLLPRSTIRSRTTGDGGIAAQREPCFPPTEQQWSPGQELIREAMHENTIGRLYPGWKVPVFPSSNDLERRFAQTLERQIRLSVKTLLSRQKKTVYPQPSESTLWTIQPSATTVNGADEDDERLLDRADGLDDDAELPCAGIAVITPRLKSNSKWLEKEVPLVENPMKSTVYTAVQDQPQVSILQPGEAISAAVRAGHSSVFFEAWPLRLQIEYTTGPNHNNQEKGEPKLDCGIEWLGQEDADCIKDDETAVIINAESLDDALPVSE
ncbi:hypothetical protein CDD80_5384 [Ophiocordyceps camponoti-rufipedis]|uniref:Uncharacterized protein n=1 Tax=Ophiocordyceps camponoti-rufipedis TaxID=2004952 RepID=A0A2C5ZDX3_9HYPO|nr:hypothetical protein CDD80_5384 [Ophiocordyceps camponoti-rufipedis]